METVDDQIVITLDPALKKLIDDDHRVHVDMSSTNPIIWLVLYYRTIGWKHSDIEREIGWKGLHRAYDYLEEFVDLPIDSTL